MTVEQLAVNGCSYMELYHRGGGLRDLADSLNISNCVSLAISGSNNSRIIRSTLKHSYQTDLSTLYVLGLTFLFRWELTVAKYRNQNEGTWLNPQNSVNPPLVRFWSASDTAAWIKLMFRSCGEGQSDYFEDLMYRVLALNASLTQRGHRLLCFNCADTSYLLSEDELQRLQPMIDNTCMIHRLQWRSVPWQQQQGAALHVSEDGVELPPMEFRHIAPGQHRYINEYLQSYINQHHIM